MLIRNVSLLHGMELDYLVSTKVRVSGRNVVNLGEGLYKEDVE